MALLLTIDASVFVSACRRGEPGHHASREFLDKLRGTNVPLIEPAILPVEVAAALSRTGSNPVLAKEFAETLFVLPHLTVVPVDEHLSRRAMALASQRKLRGADALYVTVAIQYGAHLVTLNSEQLRRAPSSVSACKPDSAVDLLKSVL